MATAYETTAWLQHIAVIFDALAAKEPLLSEARDYVTRPGAVAHSPELDDRVQQWRAIAIGLARVYKIDLAALNLEPVVTLDQVWAEMKEQEAANAAPRDPNARPGANLDEGEIARSRRRNSDPYPVRLGAWFHRNLSEAEHAQAVAFEEQQRAAGQGVQEVPPPKR